LLKRVNIVVILTCHLEWQYDNVNDTWQWRVSIQFG